MLISELILTILFVKGVSAVDSVSIDFLSRCLADRSGFHLIFSIRYRGEFESRSKGKKLSREWDLQSVLNAFESKASTADYFVLGYRSDKVILTRLEGERLDLSQRN